jgi:hypothetical protein
LTAAAYPRRKPEARRTFLEGVITRAEAARWDIPEGLTVSVREAVKTLLTIQPELCECYVRAWRDDMADWRKRLSGIPEMPSIAAALRELRLTQVTSASADKRTPLHQEVSHSVSAGPASIPLSSTMRKMLERAKNRGGRHPH